ncbi:N-acetylmuramoyl-L-alanine amidase [Riemerella anatipestifer]|nr:N-acetylmuramoyl-L-alanine amidase [Riemerella anatipestifer]
MRTIKYIVLHCTATSQTTTIESIKRFWREKLGWKNVGYHYIIKPDGEIVQLADLNTITNGVKGITDIVFILHISVAWKRKGG